MCLLGGSNATGTAMTCVKAFLCQGIEQEMAEAKERNKEKREEKKKKKDKKEKDKKIK